MPQDVQRPYFGDLHSHCSISYGHGTVAQALLRARRQLDFCSVTGHAFWPDMPTDRDQYGEIIDYHTTGFARLARNWPKLLEAQAAFQVPGEFVTFPSYEWHSLKYGDHNVYAARDDLPLRDAEDLPALRRFCKESEALAIPHHIGYASGYRGIDWDHFREDAAPFVEIFSLHGCSLSDDAPYPMLHDMGPRDFGSTAEAGWQRGYRFGIVGGTDHHSAYPGSHGDGLMGVFADELTRKSLWEAFLARRVYALTGDRIDARHFIDDAWIGSEIVSSRTRRHRIQVAGIDQLDRVEIVKNGRVVKRFFPQDEFEPVRHRYRLRITWGWGSKTEPTEWEGRLSISDGAITGIDTCFSGPPVVAPVHQTTDEEIADDVDLPHELLDANETTCAWRSVSIGNPTMRHDTTQAVSLEIDAGPETRITLEVNGKRFQHALPELLAGARCHYLRGWLTEAVRIGPAVPLSECQLIGEWADEPERDVDYYRLQVAQRNGQWAWLSPIWARRS